MSLWTKQQSYNLCNNKLEPVQYSAKKNKKKKKKKKGKCLLNLCKLNQGTWLGVRIDEIFLFHRFPKRVQCSVSIMVAFESCCGDGFLWGNKEGWETFNKGELALALALAWAFFRSLFWFNFSFWVNGGLVVRVCILDDGRGGGVSNTVRWGGFFIRIAWYSSLSSYFCLERVYCLFQPQLVKHIHGYRETSLFFWFDWRLRIFGFKILSK